MLNIFIISYKNVSFVVVKFNEFGMEFIWNIVIILGISVFCFFCSSLLVCFVYWIIFNRFYYNGIVVVYLERRINDEEFNYFVFFLLFGI